MFVAGAHRAQVMRAQTALGSANRLTFGVFFELKNRGHNRYAPSREAGFGGHKMNDS